MSAHRMISSSWPSSYQKLSNLVTFDKVVGKTTLTVFF